MLKKIISFLLIISCIIFLNPKSSRADLEDEMREMFNNMINVSDGGYYKGMGRGVVAGPSLVVRNPNVNVELINFRPPSISAGCGGIDMFLGSFSFINEEQFTQLLEAIAANAAGYAFKLALDTMCPTCGEVVDGLQKTIRAMNALAGDSCRAAKALVDTAVKNMNIDTQSMKEGVENGPFGSACRALGKKMDDFASYLNKLGTDSNNCMLSSTDVRDLMGNVVWKIIRQNNFLSGFSSGDTELARAFMSLTGTIIGTQRPSEQGGSDDGCPDMPEINTWPPTILTLERFVDGADDNDKIKIFTCNDGEDKNKCVDLGTEYYKFKGLKSLVLNVLVGDDHSTVDNNSLVYKMAHNTGSLTATERSLVRLAPLHLARLRNMAICSENNYGSMIKYVKTGAKLIAIDMVVKYINELKLQLGSKVMSQTVKKGDTYIPNPIAPAFRLNLQILTEKLVNLKNKESKISESLDTLYANAIKNCRIRPVDLN